MAASEIVKRAENAAHQQNNTTNANNDRECKANDLQQDKKNSKDSNVEYLVTQNAITYIH